MKSASAHKSPKKLRIFLVLFIVITVGGISAVFLGYRKMMLKPENMISAIQSKANISMDQVRHMATKDGKNEWSLDARTARFMGDKNEVILEDITAVFFLENGEQIKLTADQGVLKTNSKDIEVAGNILVKNKNYRLTTEKLYYNSAKRIIRSRTPVELSGDTFQLRADEMAFDLNTKKTVLIGQVKGTIDENFSL